MEYLKPREVRARLSHLHPCPHEGELYGAAQADRAGPDHDGVHGAPHASLMAQLEAAPILRSGAAALEAAEELLRTVRQSRL
jgi:hypothetical protein